MAKRLEGFKESSYDILISCLLLGSIVYFFFYSIIAFVFLSPLLFPMTKRIKINRLEKRKRELNYQFKDLLYSLSSSLNAGYSFENAITLLEKDLIQIYNHKNVEILTYVRTMKKQIELNMPIDEVLLHFSKESGLENVDNFVNTVIICRKVGGNIIKVTKSSAKTIGEKIDTNRDIEVMITGKRFEHKVMISFPFITILFMRLTSPDFIEPLYSTILGRLIMIVSMLILFCSIYIGIKILDIEV